MLLKLFAPLQLAGTQMLGSHPHSATEGGALENGEAQEGPPRQSSGARHSTGSKTAT